MSVNNMFTWRNKKNIIIALDNKMLFFSPKVLIFSYLQENTCCGFSSEVPHRGASNEYPQHMFSWRNKKYIYLIPTLI